MGEGCRCQARTATVEGARRFLGPARKRPLPGHLTHTCLGESLPAQVAPEDVIKLRQQWGLC